MATSSREPDSGEIDPRKNGQRRDRGDVRHETDDPQKPPLPEGDPNPGALGSEVARGDMGSQGGEQSPERGRGDMGSEGSVPKREAGNVERGGEGTDPERGV